MMRYLPIVVLALVALPCGAQVLELDFGEAVAGPRTYAVEHGGQVTVCTTLERAVHVPALRELGVWVLSDAGGGSPATVPMVGDPWSVAYRLSPGDSIRSDGYRLTYVQRLTTDDAYVELWVTGWCEDRGGVRR